jgi:malonyl-CoA O-methyltransferase
MNIQQPYQKHYLGIQKYFEKALFSYDDEAVVQQQTGAFLIDSLAEYKPSYQKVLELGCGTGLTTMSLCKKLSIYSLHINDFSPLLLKTALERLSPIQAKPWPFNFDQPWGCNDSYDLIFSSMAFQWSFDINELLTKSYNYLSQNGILAFSLPLNESCFELNPQQCLPLHTFDYIYKALTKVGFRSLHTDTFLLCQEFKTHREALRSIKRCGANYVPRNKGATMLDRSKLFLPSTLNYKIGIFIARKRSS